MNANNEYIQALRDMVTCGDEVSPRQQPTYEVTGHCVVFDMQRPIITIPERELDYKFMAAEAYWILNGKADLDSYVRKNLEKYSDDGKTMFGAYGPPIKEQLDYVVDVLLKDSDTRQACLTIWTRNPRVSKDIPCTLAMQFMLRQGLLHCNVFMRSQDVWLGLPYDLFTFSMVSLMVIAKMHEIKELAELPANILLGDLKIFAGSRHLYHRNMETSEDLCVSWTDGDIFDINTLRIIKPDYLMCALDYARNAQGDEVLSRIKERLC